MPRPDTIPRSVEKADHGVAACGAGREDDPSVFINCIPDDGPARCSRLPQYAGSDTRQRRRPKVRRRTAIAHRRSVERVDGIQRTGNVAVGRAVGIQRRGCGLKHGVYMAKRSEWNVLIGLLGRKHMTVLLRTVVPAGEHCTRCRNGRERAVFHAERYGPFSRTFGFGFYMKRTLDPNASSAVGMDDGGIGHAVRKVVVLGEAEGVGQHDAVREERIIGRVSRCVIFHFVGVLAGGIVQIEIMDGALVSVIERKAVQIARKNLQTSARRSCAVVALDVNIKITRAIQKAVTAVVVVVEIIPDTQCIGRNAGIDLAVAQDRDVEPVVDVRPDIEIRGVVTAQLTSKSSVP